MPTIRFVGIVLCLLVVLLPNADVALGQTPAAPTGGIAFRINVEQGVYAVYMRATTTPLAPSYTLAAQVTIKVPHREDNQRFQIVNLQSMVDRTFWGEGGRMDAPIADPTSDYISFVLNPVIVHAPQLFASSDGHAAMTILESDPAAYKWQAGQELQVFTFTNGGSEQLSARLLESDDPIVTSNTVDANPGNAITILGVDRDNAYMGNYAENGVLDKVVRIFLPFINR